METISSVLRNREQNISLDTQHDQCLRPVANSTFEISALLFVQLSVPNALCF